MKKLQLQHKLALSIAGLTALLTSLGVMIGMSTLRSEAKDQAINDKYNLEYEFSQPMEDFALESSTDLLLPGTVEAEEFTFSQTDISEVIDIDLLEKENLAYIISDLKIFPTLEKSFGEDGKVYLLLANREVITLDEDNVIKDVNIEADKTLVLATSILDLGGGAFNKTQVKQTKNREYFTDSKIIAENKLGVIVDVTEEMRALDKVAERLWVSIFVLAILAGFASWYLIRKSLQPVITITNKVAKISASGLDQRVPLPVRQDEIGVLAKTMNSMLARLEDSDRQKNQFISDASHELRTPVAVIQSEAEEYAKNSPTHRSQEVSNIILTETERLSLIISDLLTLGRSIELKNPLNNMGSDLDEVVLEQTIRFRGIKIDRSRVSAGRVDSNKHDLEKIVNHLLNNACRHAKSKVAIGVTTVDDKVNFFIEDDGEGIQEKDYEKIFERFIRLDEARTRDRGGAGLGLAVVSELVKKNRGTIKVSRSDLGGARFDISLPSLE